MYSFTDGSFKITFMLSRSRFRFKRIVNDPVCKGRIFHSMEKMDRPHWPINVVSNYLSTAQFPITPKHVWNWWSHIWATSVRTPTMYIAFFVAARSFGIGSCSTCFLHCSCRYASWTSSGPLSIYQASRSGHDIFGQPKCCACSIHQFGEKHQLVGWNFGIEVGIYVDWCRLRWCNRQYKYFYGYL